MEPKSVTVTDFRRLARACASCRRGRPLLLGGRGEMRQLAEDAGRRRWLRVRQGPDRGPEGGGGALGDPSCGSPILPGDGGRCLRGSILPGGVGPSCRVEDEEACASAERAPPAGRR